MKKNRNFLPVRNVYISEHYQKLEIFEVLNLRKVQNEKKA